MLVKVIGLNQQPLVEFVNAKAASVILIILIKLPIFTIRSEYGIFCNITDFGIGAVSGKL